MLLRIEALTVSLGERKVLVGIDLQAAQGEFVGLVGPNGSGKSTLLRCVAGIIQPTGGRIFVAGRTDPDAARSLIGYAVEPSLLPSELTGLQCLEMMAHARGVKLTKSALIEDLGVSPWLTRYVGEYSHGTRQKLAILLALVGDPALILLDESLNGLDPPSSLAVKDHLATLAKEHGRSVILATHGIDSAADLFDRLALLNEGRCVTTWDRKGLAALRQGVSLERALVDYLGS